MHTGYVLLLFKAVCFFFISYLYDPAVSCIQSRPASLVCICVWCALLVIMVSEFDVVEIFSFVIQCEI